jgi:hypothetical protein
MIFGNEMRLDESKRNQQRVFLRHSASHATISIAIPGFLILSYTSLTRVSPSKLSFA